MEKEDKKKKIYIIYIIIKIFSVCVCVWELYPICVKIEKWTGMKKKI